ncbi:transglutaminase-like domain-containing protein [Williamwhitmania taraxaci]|nr:transglutaminase-like domain-containing protein [Williamwhitmania taraxaci]
MTLLDDPEQEIFGPVAKKILAQGEEVIPFLEQTWDSSLNPLVQDRIEKLIADIQQKTTEEGLNNWSNALNPRLFDGAYWTSRLAYPELDANHTQQLLEKIKKDVWLELNQNLTALEKVKVLNYVLFEVHGFTNHSTNVFTLPSSFVHQVLETRKGNPYSLAVIYAGIAQMLELPIYGVNLPRNFLLAYKDPVYSLISDAPSKSKVLFYINPYNKGAVLSYKEIDYYLEQQNMEKKEEYYLPCTNKQTITRLIEHIIASYQKIGNSEKLNGMLRLINILNSNSID